MRLSSMASDSRMISKRRGPGVWKPRSLVLIPARLQAAPRYPWSRRLRIGQLQASMNDNQRDAALCKSTPRHLYQVVRICRVVDRAIINAQPTGDVDGQANGKLYRRLSPR